MDLLLAKVNEISLAAEYEEDINSNCNGRYLYNSKVISIIMSQYCKGYVRWGRSELDSEFIFFYLLGHQKNGLMT